MANKQEENIYTEAMLMKIKVNMKDKIRRGTLQFFFSEEPYLPETKQLNLTKWLKEDDDVVNYDKFLSEQKGFWKELECLETKEEKVETQEMKYIFHGCIK